MWHLNPARDSVARSGELFALSILAGEYASDESP